MSVFIYENRNMSEAWAQMKGGDYDSEVGEQLIKRVKELQDTVDLLQMLNSRSDFAELIGDVELFFQQLSGVEFVRLQLYYSKRLNINSESLPKHPFIIPLRVDDVTVGVLQFSSLPGEDLKFHLLALADKLSLGLEQRIRNEITALSEARLKTYIDRAPLGIFAVNKKGRIMDSNRCVSDITGYEPSELKGRLFLNLIPSKRHQKVLRNVNKLIESGEGFMELKIENKAGKLREVSVNIVEANDSYSIGILKDITEERGVTKDLLKAKANAEAANRAKSEFLANMSHEIRTPLNGVIGFSELLSITDMSEIQKQYLDNISVSANTLMELINNVLDFSKIEAGKLNLHADKGNIIRIVETLADILRYSAHKKGVEFILNIQPDIHSFVEVDELRLRQVLMNLLSNAIKFTDHGEVELSLKEKHLDREKGLCIYSISVRDTGIGISDNDRKALFKSFSQIETVSSRKFGGTGLGLVISNMLLGKMGSKIELDSTPGLGSIFSFDLQLPIFIPEIKSDPRPLKAIQKVLVVGDNSLSRSVISEMLLYKGLEVTEASDGVEALMALDGFSSPDFLIIDNNMPIFNGVDVIKKLRSLEKPGQALPILLLFSSFDDVRAISDSYGSDIQYKMIKPAKMGELYDVLFKADEALSQALA